jgi:4'-phosphopantetheinyl transferase
MARLPGGAGARLTSRPAMDQATGAVLPWPASRPLIAAASDAGPDLVVISIATPDSTLRDAARAQLRGAVREVLGLRLDRAPETIALVSTPGRALRVDLPGHRIGLSASHESGISVAAIHRCGAVGVDIMRLTEEFEWQPVARDYLGMQALARIACRPQHEQLPAFAQEWTRLEACLKCLGVGLQEWNPSLERRIGACRSIELELPAGLFGAVACSQWL